jgi:hypothetical protein
LESPTPREAHRRDILNRFEHWWATPVQFVLLLFGLANAGVPFEQIGAGTYYVLAGLLLGEPLGIMLCSRLARPGGASLPAGLGRADVLVVGVVASIGFTVTLFFATAAFPSGAALAQAKMGALLSFIAAPIAVGVARVLGVGRSAGAPIYNLVHAATRLGSLWEHQAKRHQRMLQSALATDALTDEQRSEILTGLHGSTHRDAKLLTESELELVEAYRQMENDDRAVVCR